MLHRASEKTARAAGWIKDDLARLGVNPVHHEGSYGAGCVVLPGVPSGLQVVEKRLVNVAEVLARLHKLDPDAVGLGDLGRKENYIARQLKRWTQQWQATRTEPVRFSVSTIERWFYAARRAGRDPVGALATRVRSDTGQQRAMSAPVIEALRAQYRDHPGWTCQLHYDNLGAALGKAVALPSYATLRRFMKAQALVRRAPVRSALRPGEAAAQTHRQSRETRSFEVEYVGGLWHLDFHHGSRQVLSREGQWVKPIALAVLDDRSRLACHVQWYLDETTESLVHGLSLIHI